MKDKTGEEVQGPQLDCHRDRKRGAIPGGSSKESALRFIKDKGRDVTDLGKKPKSNDHRP